MRLNWDLVIGLNLEVSGTCNIGLPVGRSESQFLSRHLGLVFKFDPMQRGERSGRAQGNPPCGRVQSRKSPYSSWIRASALHSIS